MKNSNFGDKLRYLREIKADLNRSTFGQLYGWHSNSIKGYENEERLCEIDYIAALSYAADYNFIDLLQLRLKEGLQKYPLEKASQERVKSITYIIDSLESHKELQAPPENLVQQSSTYIIDDQSMEPTITKSSEVRYIENTEALKDGHLYIVEINQHLFVRRLRLSLANNELLLHCDNTKLHGSSVPLDSYENYIRVIGKVVSFTSFLDN